MTEQANGERPLSTGERRRLRIGAGLTTVRILLLTLATLPAALVAALLEAVAGAALLRIGLGSSALRWLESDFRLIRMLIRAFGSSEDPGDLMALSPEEAPELHAMIRRVCERVGVPPPGRVALWIGAHAAIRLRGWGRGRGGSDLCLGHDLFAGLSLDQLEAVLTHEFAHARKVQRGFLRLCRETGSRSAALCRFLEEEGGRRRILGRPPGLPGLVLPTLRRLVLRQHRLLAAMSRQEEFDADRESARLCGSDRFASALERIATISRVLSRISFEERLARLEAGGNLGKWLEDQVFRNLPSLQAGLETSGEDPFSTHPDLPSRLAAIRSLPARPDPDLRRSALGLLGSSDLLVRRLVERVRIGQVKREQEETGALVRHLRGSRRLVSPKWLPWVLATLSLPLVALPWLTLSDVGAATRTSLFGLLMLFASVAASFRVYEENGAPPVPEHEVLVGGDPDLQGTALKPGQEEAVLKELTDRLRDVPESERTEALRLEAHTALCRCRYLRAHVAGGILGAADPRSVDGPMVHSVTWAAFGLAVPARRSLEELRNRSGLTTFGSLWTWSWAHLLLGDAAMAAAGLQECLRLRPDVPGLLPLLLTAHRNRGNFETAVDLWKRSGQRPSDEAGWRLVVELHLAAGRPAEAIAALEAQPDLGRRSPGLSLQRVRAHLLRGETELAREWSEIHLAVSADGRSRIRIARLFHDFREDEEAERRLKAVLEEGHHPEAHQLLARIAHGRGRPGESRRALEAAMDTRMPLGRDALPVGLLLAEILALRRELTPRKQGLSAWLVRCPDGLSKPMARSQWIAHAEDASQVEAQMKELLRLLDPAGPVVETPWWKISKAPSERQPLGPCHPGLLVEALPEPT